jgi:hypothetical protein
MAAGTDVAYPAVPKAGEANDLMSSLCHRCEQFRRCAAVRTPLARLMLEAGWILSSAMVCYGNSG